MNRQRLICLLMLAAGGVFSALLNLSLQHPGVGITFVAIVSGFLAATMFYKTNPVAVGWSTEEIQAAVAVLKKIAHCYERGQYIPGEVYEKHLLSKKNISSECVVFNGKGEVYLIERPSLAENPSEPFPLQLHSPGTTHLKDETTEETFHRLEEKELGGVKFSEAELVDDVEGGDPERGLYLLRIYICRTEAEPVNPRGRFYNPDEIPWDRVVASHRDLVLPLALKYFYCEPAELI